jgi:hypothetical protein
MSVNAYDAGGKGWQSLLPMGFAPGIAEEVMIQQTSIASLAALTQPTYGRVWGVNWPYRLWALGYWCVGGLFPCSLPDRSLPSGASALLAAGAGLIVSSGILLGGGNTDSVETSPQSENVRGSHRDSLICR